MKAGKLLIGAGEERDEGRTVKEERNERNERKVRKVRRERKGRPESNEGKEVNAPKLFK